MASEREIEAAAEAIARKQMAADQEKAVRGGCDILLVLDGYFPWATELAEVALTAAEQSRAQVEGQWKMVPTEAFERFKKHFEASNEFDNFECDFGPTLGTCPESNDCIACEAKRFFDAAAAASPPPASQVTEETTAERRHAFRGLLNEIIERANERALVDGGNPSNDDIREIIEGAITHRQRTGVDSMTRYAEDLVERLEKADGKEQEQLLLEVNCVLLARAAITLEVFARAQSWIAAGAFESAALLWIPADHYLSIPCMFPGANNTAAAVVCADDEVIIGENNRHTLPGLAIAIAALRAHNALRARAERAR